ncbi:MAG: alpha/beta fold hydrolase [Myxococcota bacterium]
MSSPERLTVRCGDGVELTAWWHPVLGAPRGALLLMPAIATPGRTLRPLAEALAREGWAVLRADYRFSGESLPRASRRHDAGMADLVLHDVPALLDELERRAPGVPLACGGHSLGGQLSALALARHPERVRAAVLVTVSYPYEALWSFPHKATVGLAFRLMPALATVFGRLPERPVGLGAEIPRTLIQDWGRWGRTGRYHSRGTDLAEVLRNVRGPVLSVCATDDVLYAPEPAVAHYLAMMPHAQVERWMISPSEMGVRQLGHFGLVKPHAAERLVARLGPWLQRVLGRTR